MSLNNRLVTTFYVEGSTTEILEVSRSSTILDLRRSIHAKAREKFQQEWGDPAFHPDPQSILITANLHGSDNFTDQTAEVGDLCDFEDQIYAVVPSWQRSDSVLAPFAALRPDTLSRPLHDNLRQHKILLGFCEDTLKQEKIQREEEREREREKREEERKQEKAEREEELRRYRAEQEEERKQIEARWEAKREEERKLEKTERQEERNREKAERAEERKREVAERNREKAEADKKYNDLRQHLLEVEETTMDTVGWIAHNDTCMLDRIKLRHLLNRGQEMLGLAANLTRSPFAASLAWREALGPSDDLSARLAQAHTLLHAHGVELNQHTQAFASSTEGMRLVVEVDSRIRLRGDKVAHPLTVPRGHFDGPISRSPFTSETPGLQALVQFVCSRT